MPGELAITFRSGVVAETVMSRRAGCSTVGVPGRGKAKDPDSGEEFDVVNMSETEISVGVFIACRLVGRNWLVEMIDIP